MVTAIMELEQEWDVGKDLNGKELGAGFQQLPSGKYRWRYGVRGEGRQSITARTMKELREAVRAIETEIEMGTWSSSRRGEIKLDPWFKEWLTKHTAKVTTKAFYAEKYRLYIKPYLSNHRLIDLTPYAINSWLGKLDQAGVSRAAKKQAHQTLSACLGVKGAEGDRRLPQGNPCRLARCAAPKTEAWTRIGEADFQRLLEATSERYRPMLAVMWELALRFGEVSALRRRDVNLLHRQLTVVVGTKLVKADPDYGIEAQRVVQSPKGGETRTIPVVPERAFRVLEEQLAKPGSPDDLLFPSPRRSGKSTLTWDDVLEIRASDASARELATKFGVLTQTVTRIRTGEAWATPPQGDRYIKHNNWHKRIWTPATVKAGLAPLRPHDLRHSAATRLIEQGLSIYDVQMILGHESSDTTKLYVHLDSDGLADRWKKAVGQ